MRIKDFLNTVPVLECHVPEDTEIKALACDSRRVTPGCLFFAVAGFATDGNRYIPMALEKGAAAVVTAKRPAGDVPYILVASDRLAMALFSARFYGNPADSMVMVGITGTNGKTSSALLLKQVLEICTGEKVGLVGTLENAIGDTILPAERTTPESVELQQLFARMRDAGCRYVVMEVSSHALALERVGGIRFRVGAFTNLTEDHLDFHKTMEAYCRTKALLFRRCDRGVANCDDEWFPAVTREATCELLTTSARREAGLYAKDVELKADGIRFTAVHGGESTAVCLAIPGRFTVYNALAALGCAMRLGLPLADAARALAACTGVKGRVEVVPTPGMPFTVLIDYAHTPDGLENVLRSVRDFCPGRLITVFGCGGDRDARKRPIMGHIGVALSDFAVITSDNPRSEKPGDILADIVRGVQPEDGEYITIENRREAIQFALDKAEKNDMIVLAGKGHETYQEICGVKHPFDEREIVAAILQQRRS